MCSCIIFKERIKTGEKMEETNGVYTEEEIKRLKKRVNNLIFGGLKRETLPNTGLTFNDEDSSLKDFIKTIHSPIFQKIMRS